MEGRVKPNHFSLLILQSCFEWIETSEEQQKLTRCLDGSTDWTPAEEWEVGLLDWKVRPAKSNFSKVYFLKVYFSKAYFSKEYFSKAYSLLPLRRLDWSGRSNTLVGGRTARKQLPPIPTHPPALQTEPHTFKLSLSDFFKFYTLSP